MKFLWKMYINISAEFQMLSLLLSYFFDITVSENGNDKHFRHNNVKMIGICLLKIFYHRSLFFYMF